LNTLPLVMKHVAWVCSGIETESNRIGTETVQDWAGCSLEVCGCRAWAGKISQIYEGVERV